jgi:hypothetical protein
MYKTNHRPKKIATRIHALAKKASFVHKAFVQPRCAIAPAAQKLRVLLALPMVSRNAPAAATGGT